MKRAILSTIVLVLIAVIAAVSQTAPPAKHRVVFQLSEPEGQAWEMLIAHVTNMRAAFAKDGNVKDGSEVEVVFFGPGLNMMLKKNTAYEARLKELSDSGVKLSACQNAMKFLNVKTEDLFPFASQVDSGIAQLARRQEAGWAYIH
jgi:uncharacterized protein